MDTVNVRSIRYRGMQRRYVRLQNMSTAGIVGRSRWPLRNARAEAAGTALISSGVLKSPGSALGYHNGATTPDRRSSAAFETERTRRFRPQVFPDSPDPHTSATQAVFVYLAPRRHTCVHAAEPQRHRLLEPGPVSTGRATFNEADVFDKPAGYARSFAGQHPDRQ